MKLGRHLSISKGIDKAVEYAPEINANSLQIFTKSPRSWKNKTISESEINNTKNNLKKYNIKGFVVHSSYLVNLATPKKDLYNKSIKELINDFKQANLLGADYFVFHPGNYVSSTKDEGIKRIIKGINKILSEVKSPKTKLLIENTAGAGTEIGSTIKEIAKILNGINDLKHIGICLDLCHLFAAGYNINSKKGIDDLIEEVNNVIGLEKLNLIHLNDSKFEINTNKDRHEHIGQGKIGIENFKYIVNHKNLKNKLFIIETPPFDGEDKDIQTILKLKGE